MLGGFGPSIAGIILLYCYLNKESRHDFWSRVINFRSISMFWCFLIFFLVPLIFGISFLLDLILNDHTAAFSTLTTFGKIPTLLISMLLIGIIAGPLSEELGWRGIALDQLREKTLSLDPP